jgi:hypothetical protein
MAIVNENLDISFFPEEVKRQLTDFYLFLAQKYSREKYRKSHVVSSKLPLEFYRPIKVERYAEFSREEIYRDA